MMMSPQSVNEETPLIQQWREIKSRHPDDLILFRVGDFYETFFQDAEEAAVLLEITLTSRNNGSSRAPLAGIPVKAKDEYVRRLVKAGRRVAICEQMEDPALAKGIVRRQVVEVITPGAIPHAPLLEGSRHNFLVSLCLDGERVGIAAADISTGEFFCLLSSREGAEDEVARLEPAEVLLPRESGEAASLALPESLSRTERPAWGFEESVATDALLRLWGVSRLEGLGFAAEDTPLIRAAGALVAYVAEVQPGLEARLQRPRLERLEDSMALDEMTRRNLELVEPLRAQEKGSTLLEVLDRTQTPMGARTLRQWLLRPLCSRAEIERRQSAVAALLETPAALALLREQLRGVRDLTRLTHRLEALRSTPRDLRALADSLQRLPALRETLLLVPGSEALASLQGEVDPAEEVCALLDRGLAESPPATLAEGGIIRAGFHAPLDELRLLRDGATEFIAQMEARERIATGIERGLKVGWNKVFGYYIEVTRANLERVPAHYIRKQTVANCERYYTQELKEWEEKASGAAERMLELEAACFLSLREEASRFSARLRKTAAAVATLDALTSLAEVARVHRYVRPEIHEGFELRIEGGRHPVVETRLPSGEFIPNDVHLAEDQRVAILTGPNAAGKSTILRQVGLIQLLAQIGSFVPANRARLPIADRVFTRVGASDNLSQGLSTFMVEMTETASILARATARSLVLLDEIGRGTSTHDGISIAQAVTEHLRDSVGAKAIFATHYHELTELESKGSGVVNWSVAVREEREHIVFLHLLRRGPADRSYGIDVGRLAGLPTPVVERAREILSRLEGGASGRPMRERRPIAFQLSLEAPSTEPAYAERLRALSIEDLTPLQALLVLSELKDEAVRARQHG